MQNDICPKIVCFSRAFISRFLSFRNVHYRSMLHLGSIRKIVCSNHLSASHHLTIIPLRPSFTSPLWSRRPRVRRPTRFGRFRKSLGIGQLRPISSFVRMRLSGGLTCFHRYINFINFFSLTFDAVFVVAPC